MRNNVFLWMRGKKHLGSLWRRVKETDPVL